METDPANGLKKVVLKGPQARGPPCDVSLSGALHCLHMAKNEQL